MRATAGTDEEGDAAPWRGAYRATLSRENHPLSFFHPLSFPLVPSRPRFILSIALTPAPPHENDVLRLALARRRTFRALLRSPFRHGNHPFGASHDSSPPPRRRPEYRNRSVGALGTRRESGISEKEEVARVAGGGAEGEMGEGGATAAGLDVGERRASGIKIIFQRAPPTVRVPPRNFNPLISDGMIIRGDISHESGTWLNVDFIAAVRRAGTRLGYARARSTKISAELPKRRLRGGPRHRLEVVN